MEVVVPAAVQHGARPQMAASDIGALLLLIGFRLVPTEISYRRMTGIALACGGWLSGVASSGRTLATPLNAGQTARVT